MSDAPDWFRAGFKDLQRQLGDKLDVADVWEMLSTRGHKTVVPADPHFPESYNYVALVLPLTTREDEVRARKLLDPFSIKGKGDEDLTEDLRRPFDRR